MISWSDIFIKNTNIMIKTNIQNNIVGTVLHYLKTFNTTELQFVVSCIIFSLFLFVTAGADISKIALHAELFGSGHSSPIFEGEGVAGGAKLVQEKIEGSNLGIAEEGSLMDTIIFVIKYLLIFAGVVALFAFLYAGFRYITSFGGEVDIAKKAMINAAIGIIIILFSWMIIQFLISFDL